MHDDYLLAYINNNSNRLLMYGPVAVNNMQNWIFIWKFLYKREYIFSSDMSIL
jgi:hypothetical protein